MKVKALVEVFDVHEGVIYSVIDSGEGWVKVLDSAGDDFMLINDEGFAPLEYEVVEE